MASTREVKNPPKERCPERGNKFVRNLRGRGFRRHLDRLPKHSPATGHAGALLRVGERDIDPEKNVGCLGSYSEWPARRL